MSTINKCLSIAATVLLLAFAKSVTAQKPNIVFIFSDDLSFRDLSAYGQTEFKTPHLDALVQQSTRFTQAYTAAPECAPSRGCLISGLNVGKSPIKLNSSARGFEFLPDTAFTFAEMLKQQGYHTGVIGKWGLGYQDSEGNPNKQGFDYHFGYLTHYEAHSYFPFRLYENGRAVDYPGNQNFDIQLLYDKERQRGDFDYEGMYDDEGKLKFASGPSAVYAPDVMDEKALAFIDDHKKQPFFLYFTTNLPHGPPVVDDFRQLKNRQDIDIASREWGAMVERLDISVGKLIEKLKAEGLYDNTYIIFASDNGYAMHNPSKTPDGAQVWEDDPWLKNKGPFYGGKFTVREAGMRVPFFVHFPGQKEAIVESQPVWLVDLFPTFCDIASAPKPTYLDGYSLLPMIRGKEHDIPKDRPFYFFKNNEQSVRQGPWFAFRSHPDEPVKLYLLAEDQHCERDLAPYYPEVVAALTKVLDTSHQPHPWYWNPGENQEIFQQKVQQAKASNQIIKRYRPNGLDLMPWERKNQR